eukprot:3492990-Rhodomonas_salina.1
MCELRKDVSGREQREVKVKKQGRKEGGDGGDGGDGTDGWELVFSWTKADSEKEDAEGKSWQLSIGITASRLAKASGVKPRTSQGEKNARGVWEWL